ncbi:MAG TPA: serine hydrolase domain-containing protein [Pseudonocardiaceae bacterium]|nr:serine hydrolase domain-containing protein [Pseudonocardiaceae bacterium]
MTPEELADLIHEYRVPGAQLTVATGGDVRTVHAGELTIGTGEPVTDRSAFPIGSITKPFTATLAMMLVAAGDVELDAPLVEYLPELGQAARDAVTRMTLRQVLSHTSGLASGVADEAYRTVLRAAWVAANCREADLSHPAGTAFSYSGVGYVLAGHLIEVLTGMSWQQAIEQMLLRPIGITPSFVVGLAMARPDATGHTVHPGSGAILPVAGSTLAGVDAPEGALALSSADLVAFVRAQLAAPAAPGALDAAWVAEMLREQVPGDAAGPFGMADGWGLGWARYHNDGTVWFGHDGAAAGASCHLRFEPASATVIALTTNASSGRALWERLRAEFDGKGPDPGPPVPGPADAIGRYRNGDSVFTVDSALDGGLLLSVDGSPPAALTCRPGLEFGVADGTGRPDAFLGRFLRGKDNAAIDHIQVFGQLAVRAR